MISNLNIERDQIFMGSGQRICIYKIYSSEIVPTKTFVFVHGLGVYVDSYIEWLKRFVNEGYVIYSFDLPGHGRSSGKRGDVGSYSMLYTIINNCVKCAKEDYVNLPLVLYGHSLGGNIVLAYLNATSENQIDCCVITAPWLRMEGRMYHILYRVSLWLYSNGISLVLPRSIKGIRRCKEEDPLHHYWISTDTFRQAQKAGNSFFDCDVLGNIRICIVHGEEDRATSHLMSESLSHRHNNFTFNLFHKTRHHFHKSEEADDIFIYINQWINESVGYV
ncbi:alpha/beta fold hydrolase [Prolixibacteraceae bacterium]|nr:alpha/beta fold hydrolase [Prolixibacteraceae bacterium]